jgi:hypothetical protein
MSLIFRQKQVLESNDPFQAHQVILQSQVFTKFAEFMYSLAGLRHKPCVAQTHGFLMIYRKGQHAGKSRTLVWSEVASL